MAEADPFAPPPAPDPVAMPPDPARAAALLRRRIAAGQADAATWRGYGDALHALGFLDRAARAWHHACGGQAVCPPSAAPPSRTRVRRGVRLYLSTRCPPPDEQDRAGMADRIGTSDYSYGFAMRNFHAAIIRIGLPCTLLRHPEYIADIRERSDAACDIHLGFHPPEHPRLLKGAYNIACFAWEFDRLRTAAERPGPHAFADQATMLSRADELWLPSRHGAAAVAPSVPVPVRVVPAPIPDDASAPPRAAAPDTAGPALGLAAIGWQPLALLPADQATMDRLAAGKRQPLSAILAGQRGRPTLFVTVLNVHDYRKQLRPMLEGFAAFARRHDAVLLVKASTPHRGVPIGRFLVDEQMIDPGEPTPALVSDRVWITDDVLTRDEMRHLYDAAAFYLCTAHAEGQNLPLLEAMARGVVPVSVDHTAMADYIRPDNAVTIRSTRRPFGLRLSRRYGMTGLETHFVSAADVRAALATAADLREADYAARSAAARAIVRQAYGTARLAAALHDLIARVAPVAAVG